MARVALRDQTIGAGDVSPECPVDAFWAQSPSERDS